ncbi:MAG: MFS transporter [Chloroflexi bacterium]|nr:MFS transporter [Chloroflexota bacterium]
MRNADPPPPSFLRGRHASAPVGIRPYAVISSAPLPPPLPSPSAPSPHDHPHHPSPSFARQRDYWAVGLNHFAVDVLNGGRNLIIALLAVALLLTNEQVALVALVYNIGNALSQPLFGLLADKVGPRWLVIGGMGWMMLFAGLAAVASDWLALAAITCMGLGSGAFHPAGTMVASHVAAPQRARATSVFFFMGQMGLFVGPIVVGMALDTWGRPGFGVIALLAAVALISGWQWVVNPAHEAAVAPAPAPAEATTVRPRPRLTLVLPLLLTLVGYSTINVTMLTFMPKLLTERAYDMSYVGWLAGVFMLCAAVGGTVGGVLADKYGGRWVILGGLLTCIVPLYLAIPATGVWQVLGLGVAGFFSGMPHSVLVLLVQGLLPARRALASGLVLGAMFFGGAVGSYAIGLAADSVGLELAMQGLVLFPLVGAVASLMVKSGK